MAKIHFFRGFSRVGHDSARGSGLEVFRKPAGRVGSRQEVGVGKLTGRAWSSQEVFRRHGSGRVPPRLDPTRGKRSDPLKIPKQEVKSYEENYSSSRPIDDSTGKIWLGFSEI